MAVVENLDVYLSDWGVPVTFPGAPVGTLGIFELHDTHALDSHGRGAVNARMDCVRLKTSVADLLRQDMPITVGSRKYTVSDPQAEQDGAFSLVALRKAAP